MAARDRSGSDSAPLGSTRPVSLRLRSEETRRRERLLAARGPREDRRASLSLGSLEDLRPRLLLCVELDGRVSRLVEAEGEVVAHASVCPHRLGPLEHSPVEDGTLRCPWHGYLFDVRSGRALDGRRLRLDRAPHVHVDPRSGETRLESQPSSRPSA